MLGTTQFIIFEIGSRCNLGHLHKECPNMVRQAIGPKVLTDDLILRCIREAYGELNFTGLVGWHFHNEPMIEHERIFSLMEACPEARYVLWTNGTIQPDDKRINLFEQVHCTDYTGIDAGYYAGCHDVSVFKFKRFDKRLDDPNELPPNTRSCHRQYVEFILDNWGTAHLCCQDWRGEVEIGSIWKDSYAELARRRHGILEQMKSGQYPERCRHCWGKVGLPKFDENIYNRMRHAI